MQIKLDANFEQKFKDILEYIAKDKLSASKKFKKEIFKQIKNIPNFPYKHRKSIYFDDENVRDLIYRGYTVTYEINEKENRITVLDIFNQNKR